VTTPISDTVCHLYKLDLLYIQPTYQIWSLYDYLIWKYEKQRKMATLSTTSAVKNSPFSKIQNGGRPLHWKSKSLFPCKRLGLQLNLTRWRKWRVSEADSCRDMAIYHFFKMAAARHLGFVLVFGPPMKSIWWSLSLCTIWLESMQ